MKLFNKTTEKRFITIGIVILAVGVFISLIGFVCMGLDPNGFFLEKDGANIKTDYIPLNEVSDTMHAEFENINIIVKAGDFEDISISYNAEYCDLLSKNGTISITGERTFNDWWRIVQFMHRNAYTVTINLPYSYERGLDIDSKNGTVLVSDCQQLETITIKCKNGVVKLSDIQQTDKLEIEMKNGIINLQGIAVKTEAEIKNTNGLINITDCTAAAILVSNENGNISAQQLESDKLELLNENGRISVRDSKAQQSMDITNENGLTRVNGIAAEAISISSKNGKITGEIDGAHSDYKIISTVKNGSSNLTSKLEGEKTLLVSNNNGAIALKFKYE